MSCFTKELILIQCSSFYIGLQSPCSPLLKSQQKCSYPPVCHHVPISYFGSWPYGPAPTPSAGLFSSFLVPHVLKEKLNWEDTLVAASSGLIPWVPQERAWELDLSIKDASGAPGGLVSGSDVSLTCRDLWIATHLGVFLQSASGPSWKPPEFTQHFCSVQKCCQEVSVGLAFHHWLFKVFFIVWIFSKT